VKGIDMTLIQVRQTISRKGFDLDLSRSADPRDPDVVRAKAIARSAHAQTSVRSRLDRREE
jgi:hypothetical protein